MVIGGLSSDDAKKLKQSRAKKTGRVRTKRATLLSDKTRENCLKKFDRDHEPEARTKEIDNLDEHVKMNDSYMRTGWYVPKKK
ncbi:conserved protein of unknown function [Nitrospina watsonii]|uniref:Uncharacterized protein n=1 Tax=Nitrospina watsonii TaxID=1323948 RepID=A0ABM9HDK2_9BACT|nr:conserved protein of unknown function [Nitrospina watsonii]